MKSSEEMKILERVFNCGEFAAIRDSLTPVHDNNDSGYCRQRHFTTIRDAIQFHRTVVCRSFSSHYANGVPSSSPGLRGMRYPGSSSRKTAQPQRGCGPCYAAPAKPDGTALRFDILCALSQGRPHSIRPTLGWRSKRPWRILNASSSVSSRALENARTETLTALDGFLTGLGDLK